MSRAAVALAAIIPLSACFRGGDVAEPVAVENVARKPASLRIARVPPVVGSVRVESTISRGRGSDSRKVTRVAVLAVEGFASVKEKITYLEATGAEATLEGKSFILMRVNEQIEVVPTDGTPPGDEDIVRADNELLGDLDVSVLMVTNRDFMLDTPMKFAAPRALSPGSTITLTLRAFDATTATFDVALGLPNIPSLVSARGRMIVDRMTGLDRSATMTMTFQNGRTTNDLTIESQATTE